MSDKRTRRQLVAVILHHCLSVATDEEDLKRLLRERGVVATKSRREVVEDLCRLVLREFGYVFDPNAPSHKIAVSDVLRGLGKDLVIDLRSASDEARETSNS